jgi:hypothetical protein
VTKEGEISYLRLSFRQSTIKKGDSELHLTTSLEGIGTVRLDRKLVGGELIESQLSILQDSNPDAKPVETFLVDIDTEGKISIDRQTPQSDSSLSLTHEQALSALTTSLIKAHETIRKVLVKQ